VLTVLGLDGVVNGILAGASISGLVIGLALQNTFANTYSGIVLSLRNDIRIGDWIELKGFAGEVQRINLRNTTIKTADNNLVYLPNRDILENPVKTHSRTPITRVVLSFGVAYESDLEHVKSVAIKALTEEFKDLTEKAFDVVFTEFGQQAIQLSIGFRIDAIAEGALTSARSRAILALKKAFDQAGIVIPIPIVKV
jgi:small conductance mechanosensitive channel